MRGRVVALLVAGCLVAGAVMARVWLAATGSYSGSDLSAPLRIASAVALVVGLILAGGAVAWPVRRQAPPATGPGDS